MRTPSTYSRRTVLAGATMALLASGRVVQANGWPSRAVTTVVPYVPGGVTDLLARLAARVLGEELKQPFIVENRAGGSGVGATSAVATSTPDGHMMILSTPAQMVTVPLLQKVPYDPATMTPISIFADYPLLVVIKSSLPAKTLDEFIAYTRSVPGKLNYSSAGTGVVSHLATALFCARAGVDITHIPYRGAASAMGALVAGEVDLFLASASDLMPHLSGDKVRVLATTGSKRFTMFPDLPCLSERFPGFVLEAWNGYVGPPGMAPELVEQIAAATIAASKHPMVIERLNALGLFPVGSSPAQFAQTIARDRTFYADAIKAAKL